MADTTSSSARAVQLSRAPDPSYSFRVALSGRARLHVIEAEPQYPGAERLPTVKYRTAWANMPRARTSKICNAVAAIFRAASNSPISLGSEGELSCLLRHRNLAVSSTPGVK
jgi:hypothetical protein